MKCDIDRYLRGEMTPGEMHALEKKALSDPFLADALEGASSIDAEDFQNDVAALRQSISERGQGKQVSLWAWTLRIAAGIAIAVAAAFLLWRNDNQQRDHLAVNSIQTPQPESKIVTDSISVSSPSASTAREEAVSETTPSPAADRDDNVATKPNPSERAKQKETAAPLSEHLAQAEESQIILDDHKEEAEQLAEADTSPALVPPVLKREPSVASASKPGRQWVTGIVRDQADGSVLPGVNVMLKNTAVGTITDEEGKFRLPLDSMKDGLLFSFIGYEQKEVMPKVNDLTVALQPDISELSEVVVVGYGGTKREDLEWDPIIELAEPAGGRKAYKNYLMENLRYPEVALNNNIEGRVTVQFTLQPSGQMTDFRVLKGLGYGCDEEVIRLIQQGPKWRPSRKNTEPVADQVRVRMRFKLPKKN